MPPPEPVTSPLLFRGFLVAVAIELAAAGVVAAVWWAVTR